MKAVVIYKLIGEVRDILSLSHIPEDEHINSNIISSERKLKEAMVLLEEYTEK